MAEKVMSLQDLIETAEKLTSESYEKLNVVTKAKYELSDAQEKAKKAWDEIYTYLCNEYTERKSDDIFKNTKLGRMLEAELERGRSRR